LGSEVLEPECRKSGEGTRDHLFLSRKFAEFAFFALRLSPLDSGLSSALQMPDQLEGNHAFAAQFARVFSGFFWYNSPRDFSPHTPSRL
jgi:hypothetical protein